MGQKGVGLYGKFKVERTDGKSAPGKKHHGCEYFVLDITHDPFALPALEAYADACKDEYPELCDDLQAVLDAAVLQGEPAAEKFAELSDKMKSAETGEWLTRAREPRPDWELPPAPDCPNCNQPAQPAAHLDDFWYQEWFCTECEEHVDGPEIEWPFLPTEFAKEDQIEALGFTIL